MGRNNTARPTRIIVADAVRHKLREVESGFSSPLDRLVFRLGVLGFCLSVGSLMLAHMYLG